MTEVAIELPAALQELAAGELRPYVNLFLDDEDIRALDGLETPLAGRRTLAVVPSVAGG